MGNIIDVAIPAYNEEESIERTLTSIFTETKLPKDYRIRVTLCLNACTDNTEKIARDFKNLHPEYDLNVIFENNKKGKTHALKKLDNYVDNEIIVFADADIKPKEDAVFKVYETLLNSPKEIVLASGNAVDPRYLNKNEKPKTLIDSLNRVFWQRTHRKMVNGPLFATRKGAVQILDEKVVSQDLFLSVYLWEKFVNNFDAIVIQGSAQSIYEIIRYRRNYQTAYRQMTQYIGDDKERMKIFREAISQFHINFRDKNKYWPNISWSHLLLARLFQNLGRIWGTFSKPTWNKTVSSKNLAE